jgi:GMP synthase (glutamine-hydrolysing)
VKRVFILQHVPNEGAGTMLAHLEANGIRYSTVELYKNAPLPEPASVAAALVMGGPMNVYEEAQFPFLKAETDFIRVLAFSDVPVLGVCLGSQLIAKALGKRVYKAAAPEIGWQDVTLTDEARLDPFFAAVPARVPLRVLQWHEDTFDVPEGAVLLAQSAGVPHQAYRYKRNVYGLQFHLEADGAMIADWFKDRADAGTILAEYEAYRGKLETITEKMYACFFGRIDGARLTEDSCR